MRNFKTIALLFVAIFVSQFTFAEDASWKELQSFHSVMAKTFHPAEEGKLQPVKDNAADLLAKAKAWQASAVPAGFKKEETAKVLKDLVAKCEEIQMAVKAKADDKKLTTLITEAHDVFHQIAEKCREGKHDHDGHGHEGHQH